MTALIAYRPLKTKTGVEIAVVVSFLLSGLLHEIAISLPVKSGYGLPMLYFIIQAVVMQLEARSSFVQKIIGHRVLAHIWVLIFLILPMPLLFHSGFMSEVLVPLRNWLLGLIGY
jgi:alginate O-acetyltransferase complex protein AlgI